MEYVYAAMLLHAAGKEINEENITKLLKAPGINVEEARVKALVAALEDVDIGEVLKQATVMPAPQAPAEAPAAEKVEVKKEEKKKEKESEEEAMAGLGALFG